MHNGSKYIPKVDLTSKFEVNCSLQTLQMGEGSEYNLEVDSTSKSKMNHNHKNLEMGKNIM